MRDGLTQADVDRVAAAYPAHLDAFLELAEVGTFPARELLRHPDWLPLIDEGAKIARGVSGCVAEIDAALAAGVALRAALRQVKRRESLRIFLRELRGGSTRETTSEFAALAEATLQVAVRELARGDFQQLDARLGVIGMGKLGGRELNPSSDIDLVFVCGDEATDDDALRERIAELCRELVDVLSAVTEDGYVFRVDLRLRPDGTQGPIVLPVTATVNYYLQLGRTWERSAWMKARPVAGNLALGESLLRGLEPFVYRRYLDFAALDELRAMKEKIEANAGLLAVHGAQEEPKTRATDTAQAPLGDRLKRRLRGRSRRVAPPVSASPTADLDDAGVLGWDSKVGVGGVREIEFFVQALQLVHCGTRPTLRATGTLEALDALLWAGLVTDDDHATLTDSYDFLRRLEHRIQMSHDRQTHALPTTWAKFDRLAAQFALPREEMVARIAATRQAVRAIFERLFADDSQRSESNATVPQPRDANLDLVVRAAGAQLRDERVLRALQELGFGRPRQVAGQLEVLREKSWGPFRELSYGADLALAAQLISGAVTAPDPDQAFSYLSRFAHVVGDRPGYWAMLRDNPHATRLLLHVFGSSSYLGAALVADPNVFERLLGAGSVAVEKSGARIAAELHTRLDGVDDPEHRLGIVQRFHREETLRIGLHETGGAARIEQTTRQLSLLAEVLVEQLLREVYEPLRTRRRRPGSVLPPLEEVRFGVVGMGKLGGRELGFGSDLDLVFVYEEDRQWRLEHTFFARLAQRLIRVLAGVEGKMYEVDTRLRPLGSRGALVVSVDAFARYYATVAGLWEKQALLRARTIYGDAALQQQIETIREQVSLRPTIGEEQLHEIAEMRRRLSEAHYRPRTRDVKYGPGGLVDLEFAVQAQQLLTPLTHSDARASQALAQVLAATFGEQAVRDYWWLCRLQARLRMSFDGGNTVVPDDEDAAHTLARRMGHQGEGALRAFHAQFDDVTSRCRSIFEDLLGRTP